MSKQLDALNEKLEALCDEMLTISPEERSAYFKRHSILMEEIRVLEEKEERAEKDRTEYLRFWDVAQLLNAYEEAEEKTHDGCPRGMGCDKCNETYAEEYQLMDDVDDELWHRGMRRNAREY